MSTYITYDPAQMWSSACGPGGSSKLELKQLAAKRSNAFKKIEDLRASGKEGFIDLPNDSASLKTIQKHANSVKRRFKHLVVIGIGGSDLGARAIYAALGSEGRGVMLHFLGNPDPEVLSDWSKKDPFWKQAAVVVISKSGSTLETMSVFMTIREALRASVGTSAHAQHVYVITDPKKSVLKTIAEQEGYTIIPHPENVGGRFAVLSSVGLFPAACAGINIEKMLEGAKSVQHAHQKKKGNSDPAIFAALHFLAYTKRKQRIHVLMPYADRLKEFSQWYRQLWAESLGKKKKGSPQHIGPTPVAALGTVDQHSQLQLYTEGLADKTISFIQVQSFRANVRVPKIWKDVSGIAYIGGHSFADIMAAELEGTEHALAKAGVPTGRLIIPSISPESLGALFLFYEIAVASLAELFHINAFDQPGVEEGKKRAMELLQ